MDWLASPGAGFQDLCHPRQPGWQPKRIHLGLCYHKGGSVCLRPSQAWNMASCSGTWLALVKLHFRAAGCPLGLCLLKAGPCRPLRLGRRLLRNTCTTSALSCCSGGTCNIDAQGLREEYSRHRLHFAARGAMLHLLMLCMCGRPRRWGRRAAPPNRQRYPMLLHVRRAVLMSG